MEEFYNIYTGEKCNNKFESFGFLELEDENKNIYLNYNEKEIVYNYKTNIEYNYNEFKFIICTENNKDMIILLNCDVENNEGRRLRLTFADKWKSFKSAYTFKIEETIFFKYLDCNISISIR